MATTKLQRQSAVNNVKRESDQVIKRTSGALSASEFFNQQLPPLSTGTGPVCQLVVELGDTLILTRRMLEWHPEFENKVMVLNMADGQTIAGGREQCAGLSQEDMLCYQSTLFTTLEKSESVYSFSQHLATNEKNGCGAIFSPAVVIFRGGANKIFGLLKESERRVVAVASIAAPFKLPVFKKGGQDQYSKPQYEIHLRERVRMIYRIAAVKSKKVSVLGAFGRRSFGDPVKRVAQVMRELKLLHHVLTRYRNPLAQSACGL